MNKNVFLTSIFLFRYYTNFEYNEMIITLNVTNIDYFNHIINILSFIVLSITAVRLDYLSQSFTKWINNIVDYFLRLISPSFNDCLLKTFSIIRYVFCAERHFECEYSNVIPKDALLRCQFEHSKSFCNRMTFFQHSSQNVSVF